LLSGKEEVDELTECTPEMLRRHTPDQASWPSEAVNE